MGLLAWALSGSIAAFLIPRLVLEVPERRTDILGVIPVSDELDEALDASLGAVKASTSFFQVGIRRSAPRRVPAHATCLEDVRRDLVQRLKTGR